MLKLHDFECNHCGLIHEALVAFDVTWQVCRNCGHRADRIISVPRVHVSNDDSPWIRTVTEVANKDSKDPHVQEFIRNPTRRNYHNWMKAENVRPLEPGEGPSKPKPPDEGRLLHKTLELHQKNKTLEIRGG